MINTAFQKAKLKRALKVQGKDYTFKRQSLNKFKEKTPTEVESITLKGIFHNVTSYVSITEGDATKKQRKFTPTVLTLYEDYTVKPVLTGDTVEFMGQKYKVTGVVNVEEADYAVDISLEVITVG